MPNYSSDPHICQCLSRLATTRRHSPATISGDRRKSGEEFAEAVLALARGLLDLGLGSGHVIAIAALNSDLYLEWLLAIAFIGGIVAPLNYRWSFEEAVFAMESVGPVMLVTDESCHFWNSKLESRKLPSLKWRVSLDSTSSVFSDTMNLLSTESIRKHYVDDFVLSYSWAPEGAVLICFTSGTTGRPKGVTISHSALIVQSLAKIAIVGYCDDDVYLHTAPLCHIGGLSSAISMLLIGSCHVLVPKFEAKSTLEAIKQHNVTSLITVPTMMADLTSSPRQKETQDGIWSVNKILNGGGSFSSELLEEATKLFPRAKLMSAYGMTEACSSLTFMTLYDPRASYRTKRISIRQSQGICVGKPAPHVELKICPDESSHFGRILTRGPHVMLRYWNQSPQNTSNSMDQHWLDTGDIGLIDEYGNLWLLGRTNGRIKSGGENIYPEEIEAILLQHPGIIGVVVVGISDARLSEMVVACIQLREGWHWSDTTSKDSSAVKKNNILSHNTLHHYCEEKNLARFKVPKKILLWKKPFPVTTTGKIIRQKVRSEVVTQVQSLRSTL